MTNIIIVLIAAGLILIIEQLKPATTLPSSKAWYLRAFIFNGIQGLIAFGGAYLWDTWFASVSLFSIKGLGIGWQVLLGYLAITFIYYWWHRARHSMPMLWKHLHQFHHSPVRIEVVTSFYKHPLEIAVNGILSSAILYLLLGLSPEAVGLCVLATGLAELVYHMNIKTPRAMGYFFQRPEMHRIHHEQGSHHYNYSELPIWDILLGTYKNPAEIDVIVGFPDEGELKLLDLLKGKGVKI